MAFAIRNEIPLPVKRLISHWGNTFILGKCTTAGITAMRRDTGRCSGIVNVRMYSSQRTVDTYRIQGLSILETVSSFISKARGLGCRENSLQCDYSYPFVHLAICLSVGVAMSSTNEYAAGEVIPE